MRVVLDTNILFVSVSDRSPFHWVIQELAAGRYTLCVTTDILVEYHEIIGRQIGEEVATLVLDGLLQLPNILFIDKYFYWGLISHDPDDNKFVDCAIAANAKYLVSEDKHFQVLKSIPFPKVELIRLEEFGELLNIG